LTQELSKKVGLKIGYNTDDKTVYRDVDDIDIILKSKGYSTKESVVKASHIENEHLTKSYEADNCRNTMIQIYRELDNGITKVINLELYCEYGTAYENIHTWNHSPDLEDLQYQGDENIMTTITPAFVYIQWMRSQTILEELIIPTSEIMAIKTNIN